MAELNPTASEATPAPEAAPELPSAVNAAPAPPADPTPAAPPTFKDRVASAGFENVADDNEAMERLLSAYTQQKDQFAAQLQEAIEQVRTLNQPASPAPAAPTAENGWWNPPKVDEQRISLYRTADGWKPETPADVRQQGEALQAYYDKWANDLVRRPNEVLPKLIQEEARRIVREELGQTAQQQHEQSLIQKTFSDNPWLFEKDPITGQTKQGVLSAEGQALNQYFIEAQQRGADFAFAWDYALTKHTAAKATLQNKQATAAITAQETNEQKKQAMLQRASGTANRTGSLPSPAEVRTSQRNVHLSPGQRFKQVAARDGLVIN